MRNKAFAVFVLLFYLLFNVAVYADFKVAASESGKSMIESNQVVSGKLANDKKNCEKGSYEKDYFENILQNKHGSALEIKWVLLSSYSKKIDIGDSFYLVALTSTGKKPTFKSSNSSVASVNTYGKVIAKKDGTANITAKISGAEASCKVSVRKTDIFVDTNKLNMEVGVNLKLKATTSNGSKITYKTLKRSVVAVDEYGNIEAKKPGDTEIVLKADNTEKYIKVKVLSPTITLSKTSISMYRTQNYNLEVKTSSGRKPTYKTNKSSVALIDENGKITAVKNGTAMITVKLDGVSKTCVINVKKPVITLKKYNYEMKVGDKIKLEPKVTSGNVPTYSSSNSSVININSKGEVTALKKGKGYVYIVEDGVKVKCSFVVS